MVENGRTWGGMTGVERGERRRLQLLDAGLESFGTRGWANTTVRDLCTAAGLSQRYFYEQFADREACFVAVLDGLADDIRGIARHGIDAAGSPAERGEVVLTELIAYFLADRRRLRVALVESFATAALRARRAELLAVFATLASGYMATLLPDGLQADRESLELSAFVLSGGIAEALVEHADGTLGVPADRLVSHLLGLYRQAAVLATGHPRAGA